jgi:hypothetical protein
MAELPINIPMETAFETYALAVGKVIFSWNRLQESLAQILRAITNIDRKAAFSNMAFYRKR